MTTGQRDTKQDKKDTDRYERGGLPGSHLAWTMGMSVCIVGLLDGARRGLANLCLAKSSSKHEKLRCNRTAVGTGTVRDVMVPSYQNTQELLVLPCADRYILAKPTPQSFYVLRRRVTTRTAARVASASSEGIPKRASGRREGRRNGEGGERI